MVDIVPDGKVMSIVDGTFGSQAWPLIGVRMEFPEMEEAYRWFAKFLLEGEVIEKLKKYTPHLLSSPSMMIKKYAKLQPRTNTFSQALIGKKIRRKDTLLDAWEDTPNCKLLKAIYLFFSIEIATLYNILAHYIHINDFILCGLEP